MVMLPYIAYMDPMVCRFPLFYLLGLLRTERWMFHKITMSMFIYPIMTMVSDQNKFCLYLLYYSIVYDIF